MTDSIEDTVLFYATNDGKVKRKAFVKGIRHWFPRAEVSTKSDKNWHRVLLIMPYCSAGRYIEHMINNKLWGSSTYCVKMMADNPTMRPPKEGEIREEENQEVDSPNQTSLF